MTRFDALNTNTHTIDDKRKETLDADASLTYLSYIFVALNFIIITSYIYRRTTDRKSVV